jgi:subtilisin family serine protease
MVTRPNFAFLVAAILGAVLVVSGTATAASITCADQPDDPAGYAVTAVHADAVQVPATTAPVAIVDTGVAAVPELAGRVRRGFNVSNGTENTADIDGHGTAAASIAAAAAGGVSGVSPSSPIIPIKIFDDAGRAGPDELIAGIAKAIDLRAGVINLSVEALPSDVDASAAADIKNAINTAVSLGIPVIAASGNEGASSLDIPAAYPHVINVGATTPSGDLASFSNGGAGLDLVAPGEDIITAAPPALCGRGYGFVSGTSFAAPAVAGTAALLLQKHPDLDVGQVANMIRLHGPGSAAPPWSMDTGFGLLDVPAVLNAPVPPADEAEVNDTIKWAKLQPLVLSPKRRGRRISAQIAPRIDPADVYRVRLRRGDRFRVQLRLPPGSIARLAFGGSKLAPVRGMSFTRKINRSGTYFVGLTLGRSPAAGITYALTLKR